MQHSKMLAIPKPRLGWRAFMRVISTLLVRSVHTAVAQPVNCTSSQHVHGRMEHVQVHNTALPYRQALNRRWQFTLLPDATTPTPVAHKPRRDAQAPPHVSNRCKVTLIHSTPYVSLRPQATTHTHAPPHLEAMHSALICPQGVQLARVRNTHNEFFCTYASGKSY